MELSDFAELWVDFEQNKNIGQNRDRISSVRRKTYDLIAEMQRLKTENTEIKAVCLSLLQILVEQGMLTEEAIAQRMKAMRSSDNEDWQRLSALMNPPKHSKDKRFVDFSNARLPEK